VKIIGDSAGGNLALSLALRLINESYPKIPALCLVSPWLHLFANDGPEPTNNLDYITPLALKHCREIYLGAKTSQKIDFLFQKYPQPQSHEGYRWDGVDQEEMNELLEAARQEVSLKDSLTTTINLICPSMISDTLIAKLPPTFLVAGDDELFYEEIDAFGKRLLKHSFGSATKHQYIVGKNELHIYLYFTCRLLYLTCLMLGVEWFLHWLSARLFDKPGPNKFEEKAMGSKAKRDKNELAVSRHLVIHSEEAYEGVKSMARFITQAIEQSHARN
jgi:acetyl esterase/lipase